uniref:Uncharacterized protein n=1 Tax=Sus scrofa TaxID=9823 RepID=A0A8D1XSH1_PIG
IQNHPNLGKITVWPPRKQRPVRIYFLFFSSQIHPQFPKEPVWFGASSAPVVLFSTHPLPGPSQPPQRSFPPAPQPPSSSRPQAPASSLGSVRKLLECEMSL